MLSAKKRIILAVTLAEPGGVQSFIINFAKWLKTQGHDVTVLAGDGTWLFTRCREAGIRAIQLRQMGREIKPWRDYLAYREMKRVLEELKPDAIHLNSTKMGVIGSLAAHAAKTPRVIYRIGGWVFLEPLSPLRKWMYRTAERLTAPKKDLILTVHPGDTEIAQRLRFKPRERIVTVPNGIDVGAFEQNLIGREEARHVLGLPEDAFVFGTVAHLYPAKDLPRYVEACALVAKQEPRARFIVVGEGMERLAIEEARKRFGIEGSFFLPGAQENAPRLYRAFDAFVLASAKEGMPWSLLEAMAAGLPCIVTDVGANFWMLDKDGGWVVPPRDPQALAKAMLEAMREPKEALDRASRAKHMAEERFPLEQTYRENERALFSELIIS